MIVPVSEFDVIYLTYDEPQKEDFWLKIQQIVPWAKRVDGVKGSDAAHKAAAIASDTERFIVIDGDNLPDANFFNQKMNLTDDVAHIQFRWRAKNNINGLCYGNGGLSCWTKHHVLNMATHENSKGDPESLIEFCFDKAYWSMHDCYSTTYPHYSAKQAWRAGFREGVKLCTARGKKPTSKDDLKSVLHPYNLHNLSIWQNIGKDIENGLWAVYGARLGTFYLLLENWDYTQVQDFTELENLWFKHIDDTVNDNEEIGKELNKYLGLSIVELDSKASEFFKIYSTSKWKNMGIMTRETGQIL